jgi:HEAT repeat protein
MTDEQLRNIVSRLNGSDQVDAFEAAKAIWEDTGRRVRAFGDSMDKRLEQPLIATLKTGRRAFNRAAAAFAMQMVNTPRTVRALEDAVKNKSERPRVRGEAAEALAHCHRTKSHNVLLAGLNDSSRDVRFWCAFSLGEMAEKRALPSLKRLATTDRRVVKGFHSVAKEAADAIENIQKGNVGHRRKRGCIFCVRRLA